VDVNAPIIGEDPSTSDFPAADESTLKVVREDNDGL